MRHSKPSRETGWVFAVLSECVGLGNQCAQINEFLGFFADGLVGGLFKLAVDGKTGTCRDENCAVDDYALTHCGYEKLAVDQAVLDIEYSEELL